MVSGDIVKLKSGGPDMLVLQISEDVASCAWLDGEYYLTSDFSILLLSSVASFDSATFEAPTIGDTVVSSLSNVPMVYGREVTEGPYTGFAECIYFNKVGDIFKDRALAYLSKECLKKVSV